MKYLSLLGALAVIYLVLVRQSPVAAVHQAVVAADAATLSTGPRAPAPSPGSALKQPIDRTHAALQQVQARNGDGEF